MSPVPSIRKLDEAVVNRIAAGEVIQRPFNALKELIENSLDAKSTKIQVTVRDGGLKLLQITDNGIGIRKEDLAIVCERFTTSKLTKFEDLSKISTYGFRGEALASISHVAHLTIVTRVSDSPCGYRASYTDSKPKGPPKPCAVEKGTQIIVEDLFYNVPTRRNALKSPSEEHNKVLEVVRKYSIHNAQVGFNLKRQKEPLSDVNTPQNSTTVDNIRLIYGATIAKELMEITDDDDTLKFKLNGQITNVNYSNKKFNFLLFINDRLVHSTSLKTIIDQVYSLYLPKGSYPFIYLSLNLSPENVDVNVHPTKHEVHFLHEEKIINKVRIVIETALLGSNNSRVYYTQAKLPVAFTSDIHDSVSQESDTTKTCAQNTVRTDGLCQKIDTFVNESVNCDKTREGPSAEGRESPQERRKVKLRSILQLRADVENSVHSILQEIFRNFVLVGFVNERHSLLQYETKMYLCNTENLSRELIYQTLLWNFANFHVIRFSTPISIKELILLYYDTNGEKLSEMEESKEETANNMSALLMEKSEMLEDYFSIEIDSHGNICTLPSVFENYMPNLCYLPHFLIRICIEVDWELEKPCLGGICTEISTFYSKFYTEDDFNSENNDWRLVAERIIFPAIKDSLLPPSKFTQDGTILEVVDLPELYKVFERC